VTTSPRNLLFVSLAIAALAAPGCYEDDPDTPPTVLPQYTLPFPDTPDQLMANFETSYPDLDLDTYRDEILADAYTFVLQQGTVEEFGLPDNLYNRDDELAIAEHLFSGHPNLNGKVLTDIEIQTLQPQGAWMPVAADDPYFGGVPGAQFRNYTLLFYFNVQGDFRYEILGNQLFYVTPDTVLYEGAMTPRYRLRGQLDQTGAMPAQRTEGATWSTVKALWQ
jgi:hypothetical protein